ncbi:MAG: preprotein translocase subunit YajC [Phycisphaerales bacterium]|jgi:preprotein translocase subunit YajC
MNQSDMASFTLVTLGQDAAAAAPVKAVGMPGQVSGPAATSAAPGTAAPAQPQGGGGLGLPLLMILAFAIMFIPMILSGRREQKKRTELMASLRKGDKVQTNGGIIGTIAELGQDDVVLKVEEGRIRFAKASVSGVLRSSTTKPESTIIEPKPEAASVNA